MLLGSAARPAKPSARGPGDTICMPPRTGMGSVPLAAPRRGPPATTATTASTTILDRDIARHKTRGAGEVKLSLAAPPTARYRLGFGMDSTSRRWLAAAAAAVLLAACRRAPAPPPRRPPTRSVRMTMDALHRTGGVPPGWRLTPPPGDVANGRRLFVDFGCSSCHAVKGEPFAAKAGAQGVGPELTGMGSHHPPEYFVESILNPDAVVVDGPGYVGPDGRSVMPAYPEMELGQLADLVAYLQSLTAGGMQHVLASVASTPAEVPASEPGPTRARVDAGARQRDAARAEARARHADVDEAVVVADDDGERAAERVLDVQAQEVDAHQSEAHGVERVLGIVVHAERAHAAAVLRPRAMVGEEPPAMGDVQRAAADQEAVVTERDQHRLLLRMHAVRIRIRDEGPAADDERAAARPAVDAAGGGKKLEGAVKHRPDGRRLDLGEDVAGAAEDQRQHEADDRPHQRTTAKRLTSHSDPGAAPGTASKYHPASAHTSSSVLGPATRCARTQARVKARPGYAGSLAGQSPETGPATKQVFAGRPALPGGTPVLSSHPSRTDVVTPLSSQP